MTSKVLRRMSSAAAISMILFSPCAEAQPVVVSVESGLQNLAQDIVTKSVAQDRNSIAVLPFPNADGSCSVLSTYLADELIQALFSTPNSSLTIVERNQLEAVINEIQIGTGGLLNPETTQSLGKVSGAKALVVGTITQIGDRVRINARLIATDTGRTISAAAISIPRTSDVDSLLRQPVTGEGGTCGVRIIARSASQDVTKASLGLSGPALGGTIGPQGGQLIGTTVVDGLAATAQTVSRSADRKSVSVVVSIVNQGKEPVQLSLVKPKPLIIDDNAAGIEASSVNGVQACQDFQWDVNVCRENYSRIGWTMISPGQPTTMLVKFQVKEGTIDGKRLAFAASFLKRPIKEPENIQELSKGITSVSITFANLPIADFKAR